MTSSELQLKAIKNMIDDAKTKGKTEIFVSAIYAENVKKVLEFGSIREVKFGGTRSHGTTKFNIISWETEEREHIHDIVDENEYMALLKMAELGL